MTGEIQIFDIIDHDGAVIEESLTAIEAANAVMQSDGREWEIRPHPAGGWVAWSRQQVANRPWAEISTLYSAESDKGVALADISGQIVKSERWPGHYEAVDRESRLETAAQFARDEFADSDREELADAIREIENCRTVEIDDAGDVWIADPQTGHWLDRDRLIALHKAILAR